MSGDLSVAVAAASSPSRRPGAWRGLPAASFFGFEVRLAGPGSVDFALALARPLDPAAAPDRLAPAAWGGFGAFVARWGRQGPFASISQLFVEIDEADLLDEGAPPGWFVRPEGLDPAGAAALVCEQVLPLLTGSARPPEEQRTLRSCLERLPGDGRLLHAGVLPGRGGLRAVVTLHVDALRPYLERIDAPLDPRTRERLERVLRRTPSWIDLGLDLTDGVGPRLGLELSFGGQPPEDPRWAGLLSVLAEQGLVAESVVQALPAWAGSSSLPAPEGPPFLLRRALSHLKVGVGPDGAADAKAYLAVDIGRPRLL